MLLVGSSGAPEAGEYLLESGVLKTISSTVLGRKYRHERVRVKAIDAINGALKKCRFGAQLLERGILSDMMEVMRLCCLFVWSFGR